MLGQFEQCFGCSVGRLVGPFTIYLNCRGTLPECQSIENAVAFVQEKYEQVSTQYADKVVVIGETGWPTAGTGREDHCGPMPTPSPEQQSLFAADFLNWAEQEGVEFHYFGAFDEPWKCEGERPEVECHWGIYDTDRVPKPAQRWFIYLLEGLRGAAARADGAVRILDLFDYVSRQVPQHKPQHPLFKGEIELNFAITINTRPPAAPAAPAPAPPEPVAPPTPQIDPDSVNPTKLRRAMHSTYDRPAFEILCKELGLDYHDLRGETLETKMLYLIDWHQRRRRYADLVRRVLEDHPYLAQELQE